MRELNSPTDVTFASLVEMALGRSVLANLPDEAQSELLRGSTRLDVPAGSIVYRGEDPARCALVVSGLLRQYIVSADGREMTLRYGVPGVLAGAVVAVSGPTPTSVQAVVDTSLLMLDLARARQAAQQHVAVAWALAEELARAHRVLLAALAESAFGTMRQRVARHLLSLGEYERAAGGGSDRLVAHVTQQQLADAAGSVREVVSRTLKEFRAEGLVDTDNRLVVLRDPVGLAEEAEWDGDEGTARSNDRAKGGRPAAGAAYRPG